MKAQTMKEMRWAMHKTWAAIAPDVLAHDVEMVRDDVIKTTLDQLWEYREAFGITDAIWAEWEDVPYTERVALAKLTFTKDVYSFK